MLLYQKFRKILLSDSEYKVLISNFSYLSILQVVGYIFPLITLPYLARVIGTDGFGKVAFASSIIVWIQTIADWGFNYTATRDVAQNRDNNEKVSEIFSSVLWARILMASLALIILLILIYCIPSFKENATIIILTFLMIPGYILFSDWFFQAIEKMKYIVLLNLLVKVLFTILVFVFIKDENDYLYQPLFTSLGYLISGLFSLYVIVNILKYKILKPNFRTILYSIRRSSAVFINNLAPNLYNSLSVILLSSVSGSFASGIYDGANKIITVVHQFILVLSRTFFPFLSRRQDKHNFFVSLNLSIGVLAAIILYVLAPKFVDMFLSTDFTDSIPILRILAISMIFMVLSNTYGTNYLLIIHKDKELRNITVACSLVGLCLAYPLVRLYSFIGAAVTVFISRFLLGVVIFLYARILKSRTMRYEKSQG